MIGVERVDFVGIPSRDRARSLAFYGETLGLARNEKAHDSFPEFEAGNVTLAIFVPEEMGREFQPLPPGQIALRVADVPAAKAKLEEAGVEFPQDVYDSSVCHMAFFEDPDGNGLMIHHRYAPYADGSAP